jgi:hypothetical protein
LQRGVEINASQDILILIYRIISLKPFRYLSKKEQFYAKQEIDAICKILKKLYIKYGIKISIVSNYDSYKKICIIDRNFNGDLPMDIDEYKDRQLELFVDKNYDNFMVQQIYRDNKSTYKESTEYHHWESMTKLFNKISYKFVDVFFNQENINIIANFLDKYSIYNSVDADYNTDIEDIPDIVVDDDDSFHMEPVQRKYLKYKQKYLKYKQKYLKYKQQFNL